MKKFLVRVFGFLGPLLIVFFLVFLFLRLTGENFYSVDDVVGSDEKKLIGYAYNENNYRYLKWKNIVEKEQQKIWALGSSRVLQFREEMFRGSSFYNAGYTIESISDFLPFMRSIPEEKYPDILIIGLDQWMFNPNWKDNKSLKEPSYWTASFSYFPTTGTITSVIKDFLNGKYKLSVLSNKYDHKNELKIGINALFNNKGFRNDGSLYYGDRIQELLNSDSSLTNFSRTYSRIERGVYQFVPGDTISTEVVNELEEFLEFCSDHGIYVIGFLPPYPNQINEKMSKLANYSYVNEIYPSVNPKFKSYNFELWDFTIPKQFGADDTEAIDGFHGGEQMYLRMVMHMVQNNSALHKFTNLVQLEEDRTNRLNRYVIYDY